MAKEINLKCSVCKTKYTEEISPNENSTEAECPQCGTWNYGAYKSLAKVKKTPNQTKNNPVKVQKTKPFKSGEKVKVLYIFNGVVSETATRVIHSIKKNIIYLKGTEGEAETGVYYNLDGSERDCSFYPQIYSKIKKIN